MYMYMYWVPVIRFSFLTQFWLITYIMYYVILLNYLYYVHETLLHVHACTCVPDSISYSVYRPLVCLPMLS